MRTKTTAFGVVGPYVSLINLLVCRTRLAASRSDGLGRTGDDLRGELFVAVLRALRAFRRLYPRAIEQEEKRYVGRAVRTALVDFVRLFKRAELLLGEEVPELGSWDPLPVLWARAALRLLARWMPKASLVILLQAAEVISRTTKARSRATEARGLVQARLQACSLVGEVHPS